MSSKDIYFDGFLYSLRRLVKIHGVYKFSIFTGYDVNRILKLYSSDISGSNYVDDVLAIDLGKFDDALYNLELKDYLYKKNKNNSIKRVEKLKRKKTKADRRFCKIGLKDTINKLKKLESDDINAKILRLCLEIENLNIIAKTKPNIIKKEVYKKKHNLIKDLAILFKIYNLNYGIKEYDNDDINSIIFFDTIAGQISWHTNIDIENHPIYNQEWDNKECSTLDKIEKYIRLNYE